MKKVDDILEEYDYKCYKGNSHKELFSIREVRELIKLAQEDAIRETVRECSENAEAIEGWNTGYSGSAASVNKQSIFSVADKLIKEL